MEAASTQPKWKPRKGMIPAFIAGLVVGPIALSYFGVTVTTRTAAGEMRDGIVAVQAQLCEVKARAENPESAKLDSNARRDLAAKFAATRANGDVDYEIVGLCSSKLSV